MIPISVEQLQAQIEVLRRYSAPQETYTVLTATNTFQITGNSPLQYWYDDESFAATASLISNAIIVQEKTEGQDMTAPVLVSLQDYETAAHILQYGNGDHHDVPIRDYSTNVRRRRFSAWVNTLVRMASDRVKHLQYEYPTKEDSLRHALFELLIHDKNDFARIESRLPSTMLLARKYVARSTLLDINKFVPYEVDGDEESYMIPSYHAYQCGSCEKWHMGDTHNYVHDNSSRWRDSHKWCEQCSTDETFYCEVTGNYYSHSEFTQSETIHGSPLCEEACSSLGWWYDDDSDGWRDPDDRSTGIPEYHEAERPEFLPAARITDPLKRTYGIELEVEFSDMGDRENFFEQFFDGSGLSKDNKFSAELDGSLNDDLGLEIISAPFELAAYQSGNTDAGWPLMCKRLYDASARGWPVRRNYGMHVNVDIRPLGMDLMEAETTEGYKRIHERASRFVAFLLNNKDLTARLAGRNTPYSGSAMEKVRDLDGAQELMSEGKYVPAVLRGGFVLEVRIFGSNVRYEGLLRNVEYVDSGLAYVDEASAQLFHSMTISSYRAWLLKPENAARWPTMAAYLAAKITPENINIKRAAA